MNIDQSNYDHYCVVCMYVVIITLFVLPGSLSQAFLYVYENVYLPTPPPLPHKVYPFLTTSE